MKAHGKVVGSGHGDEPEHNLADRGHHHLVGQPYCQGNDITGSSWSTVDLRSMSLPSGVDEKLELASPRFLDEAGYAGFVR